MLNSFQNLSHDIFSKSVPVSALRDGYGEGLLEAGQNPHVVVLTADVAESTRVHTFHKLYPDRFFEMGVSEQNMASVAAGLAVSGKIPYINAYAVFSPGRNWEQIRTTIAYNNANVKIAGHHAGISTGADGATHQAIEDIALMRAMPNMMVLTPCDAIEARKMTAQIAYINTPVYIRLQREKTPLITTKETPCTIGKAEVFWLPKTKKASVVLFAMGAMTYQTLLAARELEKLHIAAVVVRIATIKPFDEKTVSEWLKKTGAAVTVEEHTIYGGLGSAVSEVAGRMYPVPIEMIGIKDVFGQSGTAHQLHKAYHLEVGDIVRAAQKVVKRSK
ncbi:MAG: transketolase C-terminal domain-containing protein [Candidatus Paceibacterota bacterium]